MARSESPRLNPAALAALIAAALLPLWRCLTGAEMPFLGDALHRNFPDQSVVTRLLAAAPSRIPAWDPFLFCGSPLLADPGRQVCYPPALLYRLLPFPMAFGWFLGIHVLLALAGVAVLLRERGVGSRAAVIGAIGFGLGVHAALIEASPPVLCAYAWLPWIAVYASRIARGDHRSGGLGLAVSGGWLILAGAPAAIAFALVLAGVILATEAGTQRVEAAAAAAFAWAGAGLVAAAMLAPWLGYLPDAAAAGTLTPGRDALAPWDLLGTFVPRAFLASQEGVLSDPTVHWATLHSPGILLLALAGSGWWLRRGDASIRVPLRLIATGVVLGAGPWLPVVGPWLGSVWPLALLRHPGLWMELADLGLAWLAGIGAHELEARLLTPAGRRTREGWLAGVVFLASAGLGSHLWRLGAPGQFIAGEWGAYAVGIADRMGQAMDSAVFLGVGLTALWLAVRREISAAWAFRFIGVVAFLDAGIWMAAEFQPRLPASRLMAISPDEAALGRALPKGSWGRVFVTPRHQLLRAEEGQGLYGVAMSWRGSLRSDLPAAAGFKDASGDSPLRPAGADALLERVTKAPHTPGDSDARAVFDALGVRILISRLPLGGPGLTEVSAGHARLIRRDGTLRPAWILPASSGRVVSADNTGAGDWNVTVRLTRPATLVVDESAVAGWTLAAGPPGAVVTRALDALLGVDLPAGDHVVRLVYAPPAIRIGLGVSMLAAAALLVIALRNRAGS